MDYLEIYNNQTVNLNDIPELSYREFMDSNLQMLQDKPERHCVNYFGVKNKSECAVYCCIADDLTHKIYISSSILNGGSAIPSLSAQNHNFEKFEREIHENFGISYTDHEWLKPYRFSHNRFNASNRCWRLPFL